MTTAADDLAAYAVAGSLGLVLGTTAFAGPLPGQAPFADAVAAVSFVVYAAGRPSEPAFGVAGAKWEWPRVQVLTRGRRDDVASAEDIAESLYRRLSAVQAATVNGAEYLTVTALGPPTFLRWDADHRPEVAFSVEAHRVVPA